MKRVCRRNSHNHVADLAELDDKTAFQGRHVRDLLHTITPLQRSDVRSSRTNEIPDLSAIVPPSKPISFSHSSGQAIPGSQQKIAEFM